MKIELIVKQVGKVDLLQIVSYTNINECKKRRKKTTANLILDLINGYKYGKSENVENQMEYQIPGEFFFRVAQFFDTFVINLHRSKQHDVYFQIIRKNWKQR